MTPSKLALLFLALLATLVGPARAEKADREKPVNLEADRISMDDVKKTQVFEGNVILTQGTLQILTDRLVVTQDADGFQTGVAYGGAGGLARFKQKREGRDDYIEGEAERIEHNARDESTKFFVRAWVQSGLDEVRGQFISYDSLTENYLVTNGRGDAKSAVGAPQARVRAIIQPKGKNAPSGASAPSATTTLKPSASTKK